MKKIERGLCGLLIGAMVLTPRPTLAAEKVTCESRHGRYNFCRIDTDGKVELVRQIYSECLIFEHVMRRTGTARRHAPD